MTGCNGGWSSCTVVLVICSLAGVVADAVEGSMCPLAIGFPLVLVLASLGATNWPAARGRS